MAQHRHFGKDFKAKVAIEASRVKNPSLYYYRDKDQVEIDFVLIQNKKFYPLEVKKSASPKKDWIKNVKRLQGLGDIETGGVICLSKNLLAVGNELYAIPAYLI